MDTNKNAKMRQQDCKIATLNIGFDLEIAETREF